MKPKQYTQSPSWPAQGQEPARLRASETNTLDDSAQWAVSLLHEAAPYRSAAGQKERVWNMLPVVRFARHGRMRFAFALGALAVSGLFASAALAQWPSWLKNAIERMVANSPQETSTVPNQDVARVRHWAPSAPPVAPRLSPPGPETAVVLSKPETAQTSHPRRAAKAAPPEDLQLLQDAIRTLRVERNPARARMLLTTYLDRYPRSELGEEALVTLIQAAAAHHDSDVHALATRYFKTYPRGTFRSSVEKALGPSSEQASTSVKNRNE
jgi:hypothetical protein